MKLDFDKMCFVKKVYWKIKLWLMDHRISYVENHWSILEPSYYYTHTEDECQKEKQRRADEIRSILDDVKVS